MTMFKVLMPFLLACCMLLPGQLLADDKAELTALLNEFLDGATRNDPAIHNKHWAEELIYTSSSGTRFGKAELMASVKSRGELAAADISMRYHSEDVQIRLYGDVAVVTFTLVGQSQTETLRFFNSGTYLRQNGQWQVVNWQATRQASKETL